MNFAKTSGIHWKGYLIPVSLTVSFTVGSTKAAMDMFTKSLALELGPHKVSNNVSQRYHQDFSYTYIG